MRAELASAVRHVAASDCEAITQHLIAQPANTVSSLAYVVAGGLLLTRSRRVLPSARLRARAVAAALVAVGVGSVAFHGPGGPVAHWLHDLSIVAVALAALTPATGTADRGPVRRRAVTLLVAGTAAGILLALVPSAGNALAVPGLAAAIAMTARRRTGPTLHALGGLVLLAGGAALGALSRTGEPLCHPAALLQGHAAWHVLSAAGLALLACALDGARTAAPAPTYARSRTVALP